MAEIAKQQEDKVPEFAIKTQLLTRKAEEKEKLEKAKAQMHFQKLSEDMETRTESTQATTATGKIQQTSKQTNVMVTCIDTNDRSPVHWFCMYLTV